ncbi:uncharacterized protein LOC660277 [Tribolium castaneum]|uniref:Uncharacterized protein n=1 Tax=Tribolium castaneum TaxID=7070 RepID=D6WDE7_TRICA|nr:PREDICTED: uncharacterized protein LOC660277 [Tribolium castaneum]EEZ99557.1 hypothetical protein TcasGA2_TC000139 [Tribolium castaneum]|eukprot:XP_015833493.1 PREDICTED: uncharacterized protein LOC660277 [Tribolium castaneum]
MATPSAALLDRLEKQGIPKSKRKLQKHLRSAGLAYISRTGKLIPAKKVAEELCQCPQKCDERVPMESRERLFSFFYGLGEADLQNQFLRQNMDLRARLNIPETTGSGRPPRRITCKYLVPLLPSLETVEVCQKAFVSAFVITTKRVRLQREKLISSLGLNSYSSHNRSTKPAVAAGAASPPTENPKKSPKFPSACDFTSSSEPKTTPEMPPVDKPSVKRLVDNPLIPLGLLLPDGVTIAPVTASPDHDRDIAIVNNFFSNQLWKPEYIGTYS